MEKIVLLLLIATTICNAEFIPNQFYSHFPNLNTVYHGHGATSYQNVQMHNDLSVPIPKDLQVDTGDPHPIIHDSHHYHYHEEPEIALGTLADAHIVLEYPHSNDVSYVDSDDTILHYNTKHYD